MGNGVRRIEEEGAKKEWEYHGSRPIVDFIGKSMRDVRDEMNVPDVLKSVEKSENPNRFRPIPLRIPKSQTNATQAGASTSSTKINRQQAPN